MFLFQSRWVYVSKASGHILLVCYRPSSLITYSSGCPLLTVDCLLYQRVLQPRANRFLSLAFQSGTQSMYWIWCSQPRGGVYRVLFKTIPQWGSREIGRMGCTLYNPFPHPLRMPSVVKIPIRNSHGHPSSQQCTCQVYMVNWKYESIWRRKHRQCVFETLKYESIEWTTPSPSKVLNMNMSSALPSGGLWEQATATVGKVVGWGGDPPNGTISPNFHQFDINVTLLHL